ncbi:MAG: N-acetylglucosamine-6-phosphate deacetylase [Chloroflexota bacterium]
MPSRRRSGFALWGRVLTDGRQLPFSRVEVADGRIVGVQASLRPQPADVVVNSGWIAPGLIDLQVNGAGGVDLTSASDRSAALNQVGRTLALHGVTAFCPTIVSAPLPIVLESLAGYAPGPSRTFPGAAESLGVHVEGPFIDPQHRGIHDPACLRSASSAELSRWLSVGRPAIVTLAAEQPGGLEAIAALTRAGVVVSLGHSGADDRQACAGLKAGARLATHLFNAMPALHHRRPGLIGALLASTAVLGLIADGVHVDRLVVDLVVNRAGSERVVLVSDALAGAGAPPGPTRLGTQSLVSDGEVVRHADGTLAGSARLLDFGLRNVRAWLPAMPPGQLVDMATRTPANLLGLRHKGRVAVGCDADLIVLDADFGVLSTFVRGEVVGSQGIP